MFEEVAVVGGVDRDLDSAEAVGTPPAVRERGFVAQHDEQAVARAESERRQTGTDATGGAVNIGDGGRYLVTAEGEQGEIAALLGGLAYRGADRPTPVGAVQRHLDSERSREAEALRHVVADDFVGERTDTHDAGVPPHTLDVHVL